MAVSKAQMKATAKYEKQNYDDVRVRVRKGFRERIKSYAELQGKSLNQYVVDLILADMNSFLSSSSPLAPSDAEKTIE